MQTNYPKTYSYFKRFEKALRQRSGYKLYHKSTGPFYSMYNVDTFTMSPWKVVWIRVGTDIKGAVISMENLAGETKPVLPLETATMVAFKTGSEAHYFCSVINSSPWRFVITATSVLGTGGFGSPNVLKKAKVPRYNPKNSPHKHLAELSEQAHKATAEGDTEKVSEIEGKIDKVAAKLWGITDEELAAIQKALNEI